MIREIKLCNLEDVKDFNRIATEYPQEVGIHTASAIVDAKSLLGLLGIDRKNPVYCVTEDEKFYNKIRRFLA